MLLLAAIVVVGVACALIVVFAAHAERQHRRRRRSLGHMARPPAADIAYRSVVNARSAFTRSVQAYEEALASAGASASSSALVSGEQQTAAADIEVLEQHKDARRDQLLAAQRTWEDVRPANGPNSPVSMWIGAGELRGWSLGLIGHESTLLRIEHALDPTCWVVLETRRVRFGPALGAERIRLGLTLEGAAIEHLPALFQTAMGSPEIAVRPGTSLVRLLARKRVSGKAVFDELRDSVDSSSQVYVKGLSPAARQESMAYLTSERGIDMATRGGVRPTFDRIALRITSAGPSLMVGAWTGRRPTARVMAGSNHQAWLRVPSNR